MVPYWAAQSTPATQPGQEGQRDGEARVAAGQARGQVRGQAQDRAHGQVVVAADDDHRLAQREQREHAGVDQDELDVGDVEEPGWIDTVTATNSTRTTMMPDSLIR